MTLHEMPTAMTPWSKEVATELVRDHAAEPGPLLPVLHALHEAFGYIDPEAIELVAQELNISRADVYGVVTFYADFRRTPPGRVRIQVCRGEACQAVGGRGLVEHATRSLGLELGTTAPDGSVSLEEVFCLGNCALGPSVTVSGHLRGRVEPADFDRLVSDAVASGGGER